MALAQLVQPTFRMEIGRDGPVTPCSSPRLSDKLASLSSGRVGGRFEAAWRMLQELENMEPCESLRVTNVGQFD